MKIFQEERSFLITNVLPSLIMVLSIYVYAPSNWVVQGWLDKASSTFSSYLGIEKIEIFGVTFTEVSAGILFILFLTVLLSLVLSALQNNILKFYIGDNFPRFLKIYLKKKHDTKAQKLREQLQMWWDRSDPEFYERLESNYFYLNQHDPGSKRIKPTKLGNIIEVCYVQVENRYGTNLALLWEHLLHLAPDKYRQDYESSYSALQAALNLSAIFLGLAFFAFVLNWIAIIGIAHPFRIFFSRSPNLLDFLIPLLFLLLAQFTYNLAIQFAYRYTEVIKQGVDYYRFDILEKMHFPEPENSGEERVTWGKVSEFFRRGYEINVKYRSNKKVSTAENSNTPNNQTVITHHLAPEINKGIYWWQFVTILFSAVTLFKIIVDVYLSTRRRK